MAIENAKTVSSRYNALLETLADVERAIKTARDQQARGRHQVLCQLPRLTTTSLCSLAALQEQETFELQAQVEEKDEKIAALESQLKSARAGLDRTISDLEAKAKASPGIPSNECARPFPNLFFPRLCLSPGPGVGARHGSQGSDGQGGEGKGPDRQGEEGRRSPPCLLGYGPMCQKPPRCQVEALEAARKEAEARATDLQRQLDEAAQELQRLQQAAEQAQQEAQHARQEAQQAKQQAEHAKHATEQAQQEAQQEKEAAAKELGVAREMQAGAEAANKEAAALMDQFEKKGEMVRPPCSPPTLRACCKSPFCGPANAPPCCCC